MRYSGKLQRKKRASRSTINVNLPFAAHAPVLAQSSGAVEQEQQQQQPDPYGAGDAAAYDDAAHADGMQYGDAAPSQSSGDDQPGAAATHVQQQQQQQGAQFSFRPQSRRVPQQRSAAANNAAAERNWAQHQQPAPWISAAGDRIDLLECVLTALANYILQRCVTAPCPSCGCQDSTRLFEAEVIVVTFEALLSIMVPKLKCNRCAAAYNLHPFRAGCYPGTPVKAVQLERNNPAPPLWFRADVLQQLYTKR